MSTSKSIGVALTRRDADIIAWANLLVENNESPGVWIQAILAAETLGRDFDAGTVYVPSRRRKSIQQKEMLLFGDDTEQQVEAAPKTFGWTVRGPDGEYTVGTVLNIGVSRESTKMWVAAARAQKRVISRYIKIIIRKHITVTHSEPSRMPDLSGPIDDIFFEFPRSDTHLTAQQTKPSTKRTPAKAATQTPISTSSESLHETQPTNTPLAHTHKDQQTSSTVPPVPEGQTIHTQLHQESNSSSPKRKNPLLAQMT